MGLYAIIKELQNTSGAKAKKAILKANKSDELLRQYLKAVYDPRINYYITKMPKVQAKLSPDPFDQLVLDDMARIANREVTGKKAKEYLHDLCCVMDEQGYELLSYIIARDIRAGVAESTILSVFPGLFYVPPYQRCASMDVELKERFGQMPYFFVQTKSDGQFCYAINRATTLANAGEQSKKQAMSRAGSLYPQWLANHITYGMPEGRVAMGELLVVRDGKVLDRKTGNGILNSVLSGDGSKFLDTDSVKFVAWDMVDEEEFDAGKSDRPYEERWRELAEMTSLERIPSWTVKSVKDANRIQTDHTARGEEGTVWKNPEMGWRDCSSGDKDMMKAKTVFEAEYKITGAYEGKGKAKGMLGGFNLATSDDMIQFDCGSGFSDDQREEYWKILQQNPEAFNGTVVTAEGNDIVTSKSKPGKEAVFLPIFVEIRLDKKEADSRERVWEQFNAAKEGRNASESL